MSEIVKINHKVPNLAPLTNVHICRKALNTALNRGGHLPGITVFYGPAGYGKTKAVAYNANDTRAYSADTYDIDDNIGLTYTPWREDPEFESVSRANLFNFRRLIVVDNEIMTFQGVELVSGTDKIRLTGIVRGAFGTVKAVHANNAEIWLIPAQDDIFFSGLAKSGTLKLLPYFGAATLAEGDATARAYTLTNKAVTPFIVGRIEAVRLSADVTINWWPRDVDPYGAGVKSEDYSDQNPFIFNGDFMYRIGTSGDYTAVSATSLRLSRAGAFTVYIMARQNGALSSVKSLTVAAADGTYTI